MNRICRRPVVTRRQVLHRRVSCEWLATLHDSRIDASLMDTELRRRWSRSHRSRCPSSPMTTVSVEQIICNSRSPYWMRTLSDRLARHITYRCSGSEPMSVRHTDWSMTCCIITRSSASLMLQLLLLLAILMQMSDHPQPWQCSLGCRRNVLEIGYL